MNKKLKKYLLAVMTVIIIFIITYVYKKIVDDYRVDRTFIVLNPAFIIANILVFGSVFYTLQTVSKIAVQLEFGRTRKEIVREVTYKGITVILIVFTLCFTEVITNHLMFEDLLSSSNISSEEILNFIFDLVKIVYISAVIFYSLYGSFYVGCVSQDLYLIVIILTDVLFIGLCYFNKILYLLIMLVIITFINIVFYKKANKVILKRIF